MVTSFSDSLSMRIEGGSMNLSRLQGEYVYPVQQYNTRPVENVPGVRTVDRDVFVRSTEGISSENRPVSDQYSHRSGEIPNRISLSRTGEMDQAFESPEFMTYTASGALTDGAMRAAMTRGRFLDVVA